MSDLRQRLEDATAEAFARYWTDPPPEFMQDVDDAALAVFADWLRERAQLRHEQADADRPSRYHEWLDRAQELESAADEIAPKEDDHA